MIQVTEMEETKIAGTMRESLEHEQAVKRTKLRQQFAGQALQGLLSNPTFTNESGPGMPVIINLAARCADALIAKLDE